MIEINTNQNNDWKSAIKQGVKILVNKDYCNMTLYEKIIENVEKNGPYFVLAPQIALAHAEPGPYIKKTGLSLIVFKNKVSFSNDRRHDVNLLFTLSAKDGNDHMEIIRLFANYFSTDKKLVDKILNLNKEEIKFLLKDLFN